MKHFCMLSLLIVNFLIGSIAYGRSSFLLAEPQTTFRLNLLPEILRKAPIFNSSYRKASAEGYQILRQSWGSDQYRQAIYLLQDDSLSSENLSAAQISMSMSVSPVMAPVYPMAATSYASEAQLFIQALSKHKQNVMKIYKLKNYTYNKLAVMAFGIFGVESKFGKNWKYKIKESESGQKIVSIAKGLRKTGYSQSLKYLGALSLLPGRSTMSGFLTWAHRMDDLGSQSINSRGGTQIKYIPEAISKAYPNLNPNTLQNPEHAAIATIGYLAESLRIIRGMQAQQLRNGIQEDQEDLGYIDEGNIFDYLPYVYSGRMAKIYIGPTDPNGATVIDNLYILEMKKYMRWFLVMERTQ